MSSLVLLQQLLVLFAMMVAGYISFRKDIIDTHAYQKLSSLVMWVLNPFLVITGMVGKDAAIPSKVVLENVILVGVLYGVLCIAGIIYARVMRFDRKRSSLYQLMTMFPNVGFMGIPLVKVLLGSEYIIFVAFYMLAFNLLAYSYGIILATGISGEKAALSGKNFISIGNITSLIAIIIFAFHIQLPDPAVTFVNYMGNAAIPISMIIIGASLAQQNLKEAFLDVQCYIFTIVKMLVLPVVIMLGMRMFPFDSKVMGVFMIMLSMPVASMSCMLAEEYGKDSRECGRVIAFTTMMTVVTAPVVALLVG